MDTLVKTVTIKENQLFRIPDFTEDLQKSHSLINEAGVFKVLLDTTIKDKGSPITDFIHIASSSRMAADAKKQFVIGLLPSKNVYGHRNFSCSEENVHNDNVTPGPCHEEDVKDFVAKLTEPANYNDVTCCSALVDPGNEETLIRHFFTDVIPHLVSVNACKPKPKSLNALQKQGKIDSRNLKKFMSGMETLPFAEKLAMIDKCLASDKRQQVDYCNCRDCLQDEVYQEHAEGVMYGSGIEVTFEDRIKMTEHFGLYCLASTSILRLLQYTYPGISLPFLYYGSKHSFFPAHIEDQSLYSWNYLHYGQPKIWFVVPPRAVRQLHKCLAQTAACINHSSCANLLGHKFFLPTPTWLQDNSIPFKVVIQRAGECVVVLPNAVHFGFNCGYNISEACNFATTSWIPYGMVAPKCSCMGGEVHFEMQRLIAALRPDLLQTYISNSLPSGEGPHFYNSILRGNPADLMSSVEPQVMQSNAESQLRDEEESGLDAEDKTEQLFADLPTRPKGRKIILCPKASCSVQFKHGKKMRLFNHVQKYHSKDPDFKKLKDSLLAQFPERNKTNKKPCNICGKLIAGNTAQMKDHQKRSACEPV